MNIKRRSVIVVTLIVLGGLLLPASGAVPLFSGPTDQVDENVELVPSNGPNGDYAYLDDGELTVDISPTNPNLSADGVNPDSVTQIDDVFTVRYKGSRYAHVWITHDDDAITFLADGRPIGNETNNVTLGPNETQSIGLSIDTTRSDTITEDDFTIHTKVAEPPESDETDSLRSTTSIVSAPSPSERIISVFNLDAVDPTLIELDGLKIAEGVRLETIAVDRTSDGNVRVDVRGSPGPPSAETDLESATRDVALGYVAFDHDHSPGEFESVTYTFTVDRELLSERGADPEDLQVYRHDGTSYTEIDTTVIEANDDTVRIAAETDRFGLLSVAIDGPNLTLIETSMTSDEVAPGETTSVTATVENTGGSDGETTLQLFANGDLIGTQRIAVGSDDTETVTFEVAFDDPGEYTLSVDSKAVGTLTVSAESDGDSTTGTSTKSTPNETTAETDSTTPETQEETPVAPLEEASGFGLTELLGVLVVLGIVLITMMLVRRTPST